MIIRPIPININISTIQSITNSSLVKDHLFIVIDKDYKQVVYIFILLRSCGKYSERRRRLQEGPSFCSML